MNLQVFGIVIITKVILLIQVIKIAIIILNYNYGDIDEFYDEFRARNHSLKSPKS